MSKHTPGPWRYKRHSVDSNYMLIYCSSDNSDGDNIRGYCGEANARLIAAAPELLEACKMLLVNMNLAGWENDYAAIRARAAIQKATGEQAWRETK